MPGAVDAINSAARSIKARAGISGVKPPVGSPATGGAVTPAVRSTPAVQVARANARIMGAAPDAGAAQGSEPVSGGSDVEELRAALAKKDKAIADGESRIKSLEESVVSTTERLADVLSLTASKATGDKGDVETPLPENFDQLPEPERMTIIARREAEKASEAVAKRDREKLQRNMGPVLDRFARQSAELEKQKVSEMFPNFDWDAHADDLKKHYATVPGLVLAERVKLIGSHEELAPPRATPPVTLPSRPSAAAASGGARGAPTAAPAASKPSAEDFMAASVAARQGGNKVEADKYLEAALAEKVRLPSLGLP